MNYMIVCLRGICELYDCVLDLCNLCADKETFRNFDLHISNKESLGNLCWMRAYGQNLTSDKEFHCFTLYTPCSGLC